MSGFSLSQLQSIHPSTLVAADLSFAQNGVPAAVSFSCILFAVCSIFIAKVDKTALFLIGAVAGPIAQNLVDGSVLAFSQADISYVPRSLHTI